MKNLKNLEKMLIFLVINTITFYASAYFIKDTGSGIFMLILSVPIILFISSLIFGWLTGFKIVNFLYPILTGLIFLPCVYIFYNSSALIYIPIYGFIALAGVLIGGVFYKGID